MGEACRATYAELEAASGPGTEQAAQKIQAARALTWRRWARSSMDNGGKAAHAWARPPQRWRAPVCTKADGTESAHPQDLADNQRSKFATMWSATDQRARRPLPPVDQRRTLPALTATRMRKVARSWSLATAAGTDGLRMRQLAWLCDSALEVLAIIFQAAEAGRDWPQIWQRCPKSREGSAP